MTCCLYIPCEILDAPVSNSYTDVRLTLPVFVTVIRLKVLSQFSQRTFLCISCENCINYTNKRACLFHIPLSDEADGVDAFLIEVGTLGINLGMFMFLIYVLKALSGVKLTHRNYSPIHLFICSVQLAMYLYFPTVKYSNNFINSNNISTFTYGS